MARKVSEPAECSTLFGGFSRNHDFQSKINSGADVAAWSALYEPKLNHVADDSPGIGKNFTIQVAMLLCRAALAPSGW